MSFINGGLVDFATDEQWDSLMTEPIAEYTVWVKENGKKVAVSQWFIYDEDDLVKVAKEIESLAKEKHFPFVTSKRALNNRNDITESGDEH